jgi:hypothetical protein
VKMRLSNSGIIAIMVILYLLMLGCSKKSAEDADLKKPSSSPTDSGKLPVNQPASELERLAVRSSQTTRGTMSRMPSVTF